MLRLVTCAPRRASTPGVPDSSVCSNLAQVQFVGKNSTHPEIGTYVHGNDNNNFAPSVGFSWNVPWFGEGKTVVRGGIGLFANTIAASIAANCRG